MATFRFNRYASGQGADTFMYFSNWFSNLQSSNSMGSTQMTGSFAPGDSARLIGSGLVYSNTGGPARPIDGFVTKITLTHTSQQIMSVTDMRVNATILGQEFIAGPTAVANFFLRGNDSIFGSTEGDTLYGGNGNDRMEGGAKNDWLYGEDGRDTLLGQAGDDYGYGGSGNDSFVGDAGNDSMYAGDGRDVAVGGTGNDYLNGDSEADTLTGGTGNDTHYGGDGNDLMSGGDGDDYFYANNGDDRMIGGAGSDNFYGDDGNDLMTGGAGADSLYGGSDEDRLFGGTGSDNLDGGGENDFVNSGLGNDTVYGGGGADRFVFDTALGISNIDRIEDFATGIDQMLLDNDIFTAIGPVGALGAGKFHIGPAAASAGHRIIYDPATGNLYYDANGNAVGSSVQFATLDTLLTPVASDFLVIG
jgi:Ca2+-binding RTX toxin-like protein